MTWQRMRNPWLRAGRGLLYAVGAFGLLIAFAAWVGNDRGNAVLLAVLSFGVIALVLWMPAGFGFLAAWRVGRTDPNVAHPIRHSFDEDGLLVKCETAETRLYWQGMSRVAESPEFFFFFYSPGLAYYLPKRVVADPDALRLLATERYPGTTGLEQIR